MAEISKITIETGTYTIKDETARNNIIEVNNNLTEQINQTNTNLTEQINTVNSKIPASMNKNIRIKNYYNYGANLYIVELDNVEKIEVMPTNGNKSSPSVTPKNIGDFVGTTDYDVVINGGLFNTSTYVPNGYNIFDGVGYDAGAKNNNETVIGFDANNNLMSINVNEVNSLNDLLVSGYKNATTAWNTLIKNGVVQDYNINIGDGMDILIGQLTDGNYIIGCTYTRTPLNEIIQYPNVINLIQSLYPNIKTLCVNDGGGSAQIYTQNMSVLPPTDIENFLGRKVPTAIGFKVRKGDV